MMFNIGFYIVLCVNHLQTFSKKHRTILVTRLNATQPVRANSWFRHLSNSPKPATPAKSPIRPSDHFYDQARCLAVLLIMIMNVRACSWTARTDVCLSAIYIKALACIQRPRLGCSMNSPDHLHFRKSARNTPYNRTSSKVHAYTR